jgi:hypothetical protein
MDTIVHFKEINIKFLNKNDYVMFQVTYLSFSFCKIGTFCFKLSLVHQSRGFKSTGFVLEETELGPHGFKPEKMIRHMNWF